MLGGGVERRPGGLVGCGVKFVRGTVNSLL